MKNSPVLLLASLLALVIVVAGIANIATINGSNVGASVDTTAPIISGITVSVTETTATISWTTDELATSTIDYNQCAHSIGCITCETIGSTADKTSHSVNLSDLSPGTTWSFQVKSKDASGNLAVSSSLTFTTSNLPGTGNISGEVTNYILGECVYIFKQGEMQSYDSVFICNDGYYIFHNVPAGQYEIYTTDSYCPITGFTGDPSAVVTVFEGEETQADLTQVRSLWISVREQSEPEPTEVIVIISPLYFCGCVEDVEVVEETNPTFYWMEINNAAYYIVELWSIYTDKHPQNKEYDEIVTTTTADVKWPTDLNTLIYNEFRLDVSAYTADDLLIASNYLLFCVDQCDGG